MTKVHILLATRNGALFLQDQLQSYLDQTHADWSLWVSDDASTDETGNILRRFKAQHPEREVTLLHGPNRGLFANFMHLLRHPDVPEGFVALSDQDDVWLPHRLDRALAKLRPFQSEALYCSTRIITDAHLTPLSKSAPQPLPKPKFHNALVQNVAAGNTMMLNPQAMYRLRSDPLPSANLPYHDWWVFLRLLAVGADLVRDPRPSLYYRQHDQNFLGHRKTRRLRRLRQLLDGTYGEWVAAYSEALLELPAETLLPENRRAAEILLTQSSRLKALWLSKARRCDFAGLLLLPLLATLNRI